MIACPSEFQNGKKVPGWGQFSLRASAAKGKCTYLLRVLENIPLKFQQDLSVVVIIFPVHIFMKRRRTLTAPALNGMGNFSEPGGRSQKLSPLSRLCNLRYFTSCQSEHAETACLAVIFLVF